MSLRPAELEAIKALWDVQTTGLTACDRCLLNKQSQTRRDSLRDS